MSAKALAFALLLSVVAVAVNSGTSRILSVVALGLIIVGKVGIEVFSATGKTNHSDLVKVLVFSWLQVLSGGASLVLLVVGLVS